MRNLIYFLCLAFAVAALALAFAGISRMFSTSDHYGVCIVNQGAGLVTTGVVFAVLSATSGLLAGRLPRQEEG